MVESLARPRQRLRVLTTGGVCFGLNLAPNRRNDEASELSVLLPSLFHKWFAQWIGRRMGLSISQWR
jgi:hypothetical protein